MSSDSRAQDDLDEDAIKEARLWRDRGWTARVIKNPDDEGWAVEMLQSGEPEPALVGPWTMGRDKKNPKPLDVNAFNTLVKTASEVLRRHEQALYARTHRDVKVQVGGEPYTVALDIVPDDDDPHAWMSAADATGEVQARVRVRPDHKLTAEAAAAWVAGGFGKP
jgi:hypothetical protein